MNWLTGGRTAEAKRFILQLVDVNKRERAAEALIRLGTDAVPALVDALQTGDESLSRLYGRILLRIGPPALPFLTKALTTAHPLVRGRAAEILGMTRNDQVVPTLSEALRSEYYTVREKAATALGSIGNPAAIDPLLKLLRDSVPEVRIAAIQAVAKFCDPLTFDQIANILLDDPMIEVRQTAARALGNTRHPHAGFFLVEALRDSFWWYEREEAASELLQAIEDIGIPVVDQLVRALGDKEGTIRKYAARILGRIGDPRVMGELGMTLYDLHHEVGSAAAEALAQYGAPAIDILSTALRHPEPAIRQHAVTGLGQIQDVRVAPLLIEMVKDPDRSVQKQAVLALGQLRDEHAWSALRVIAADRSDRELAALARQYLENGFSS